jgi:hypothetical protein
MFEIKEALNGNVVLTVTDSRGTVVLHETVKAEDAEEIGERTVSVIK